MSGKRTKAVQKSKIEPIQALPLCHRCEYRAQALETGVAPRYECGESGAVCGCYMYRPVRPLVLEADEEDKRILGGPWMISSRAHAVAIGDVEPVGHKVGKHGLMTYWRPPCVT